MPPVTARYCWTVEDLLTGSKYTTKYKWYGILSIAGAGALFCWILLKGHPPGKAYHLTTNLTIVGLYAAVVILGVITVFLTRKLSSAIIRRGFAKRPDANQEIEWTIGEQGITTSSEDSKSQVGWTTFQKVISTPVGFLFCPSLQIFYFIPHRAFNSPEDIETVKSLARVHAKEFKEVK